MIHIWSGVFIALSVVSAKWYISENLSYLALYRNVSGAIVNVILNLWLIPGYGVKGAAIATLVSYCMTSYIFDIFNYKTRKTFLQKTYSMFFIKRI